MNIKNELLKIIKEDFPKKLTSVQKKKIYDIYMEITKGSSKKQ